MISVVVPVFNGADVLATTLPAVLALEGVAEWVWVDDGSTDETAAVLARRAEPPARVVRLPANRGRAAARNAGAAAASGSVVVFLDADVEPPAHLATALADAASRPGAVASVARLAPVLDRPADPYQDYLAHHPRGPGPDVTDDAALDWRYFLTTACAVRRRSLTDAGGFRQDIAYGEDVALAADLARVSPDGLRLADASVRLHDVGDLADALTRARWFGRSLRHLRDLDTSVDTLARLGGLAVPARAGAAALRALVRRLGPGPVRRKAVRYLLGATIVSASGRARD